MKVGKCKVNDSNSQIAVRSNRSIQYALDRIFSSDVKPYIRRILLYGSCARRTQDYNSDIDLFLELDPGIDLEKYHDEILKLKSIVTSSELDLPEVDLKVAVGNNWEKESMLFYKNVKRDGIVIWEKM